jgi:hypothetical protein
MPRPPDPPDEFLVAIGKVTARWNYLEQVLNMLLIHMLGESIVEERPHIVFAHMAFPQKMDVLSALAEQLIKGGYPWLAEHKSGIVSSIKQAQNKRNMIIHDVWGTKGGKVVRASITARGSFKLSWTEVVIEDLNAAIQIIEDAQAALEGLGDLFRLHAGVVHTKDKK